MSRAQLFVATALTANLLLVAHGVIAADVQPSAPTMLRTAEATYATANDAASIVSAIDSGLFKRYHGRDRRAWQDIFLAKRAVLQALVKQIDDSTLSSSDARVLRILRSKLKAFDAVAASADTAAGQCSDTTRQDLNFEAFSRSLGACFTEIGGSIVFEGKRLDRVSALALLHRIEEPARRKALFLALAPLWQAVNDDNSASSPYRRLIAMAATHPDHNGNAIDNAARTLGVTAATAESWLIEVLDEWRRAAPADSVEPWDYWAASGEADRQLQIAIPRESLRATSEKYYGDLGADLGLLGVHYDLAPRPGKSTVAYTDFLTHGREIAGGLRAPIARISANYSRGGLYSLNELVHEAGHAIHISAIHNRPAYDDWPADLFSEAFADVTSWSTYESAWQQHYLGAAAPQVASLRALFTDVVLDMSWALFEIKMLHERQADPNVVWSEITNHYLHIARHPELSWWAMRGQLVDTPGYMVNYGLGAIVTADLRQRTRETLGGFDTGNLRWYAWMSERLLRYGSEREAGELIKEFLGRPVSTQALLTQLRRIKATAVPGADSLGIAHQKSQPEIAPRPQ
jgi:Peptidase family M3